jgi:hypothetical protein
MYAGLFEAHITVEPLSTTQTELFTQFCFEKGLKAIQIELARGSAPVQPMTCSRHEGDFLTIKEEVLTLAKSLKSSGFSVNRVKIEAYPLNSGIPHTQAALAFHSEKNYFECHIKLRLNAQDSEEKLLAICDKHQAHLSNNAYKKLSEGYYEKFVTQRLYGMGKMEVEDKFEQLKFDLEAAGFEVLKSIYEYCVYDDNVNLDDNWLTINQVCEICETPCK